MQMRSPQGRRQSDRKVVFPFYDAFGNVVPEERRRQPDRRLGHIESEWLEIMEESGHSTFK